MNNHQNMHREIKPLAGGYRGVNPIIARLRRKLDLTYIVDNPFEVPVAQSTAGREDGATKSARK